jgi:hypothetical protein
LDFIETLEGKLFADWSALEKETYFSKLELKADKKKLLDEKSQVRENHRLELELQLLQAQGTFFSHRNNQLQGLQREKMRIQPMTICFLSFPS